MKLLCIILFCVFLTLPTCKGYDQRKYVAGKGNTRYIHPVITSPKSKESTAEGIGRLTSSLLHDIHSRTGKNFNIVLSPLSIWVILAVLLEGAGGKTERQLQAKLNVTFYEPEDGRQFLRSQYRNLKNLFEGDTSDTEFSSLNYLITNKKLPSSFQNVVENFYDGKYFSFDQKRKGLFSIMMNNWATDKSNGKINNIMSPAMLDNLVMLIGNAVYFKAKWKNPFDPLDTISLPFKDDNGEVIRSVPMMNMATVLPLGYNADLDAEIIEIPYSDNKTSMIVILPHQKVGLRTVLQRMNYLSLREIIPQNLSEETVQLTLPRFHVVGKMYLNEVLRPDLSTVFSPENADFPRMGNDVYVSRIYHKAEIENTEEGTTAAAITKNETGDDNKPALVKVPQTREIFKYRKFWCDSYIKIQVPAIVKGSRSAFSNVNSGACSDAQGDVIHVCAVSLLKNWFSLKEYERNEDG